MRRSAVLRTASAAGLSAVVVAALVGAAPGAHASSSPAGRATLAAAPSWVGSAKHLGATDHAKSQALVVYLSPKGGQAALKAQVAAVSDPSSASYRHFLTSAQYFATFAPSAAQVKSVRTWLSSTGLKVTGADAHNRFLNVSGTASQAEKAFGVSLQQYNRNGAEVQAPAGATSIPAGISASVLAVSGLDTTSVVATPAAEPPPAFAVGHPCSLSYGQLKASVQADMTTPLPKFEGKTLPYSVCGYTGPQYRAAYESGSPLTGAGVTVGVIDAYNAPTIASDAETYADAHGDGSYAPGQFTQTAPASYHSQGSCGPNGWWGEETLDIEAVHAMAPGANIHFYGAPSCKGNDLLDEARLVVDKDKVQVVSNSYGYPDQFVTTSYIQAYDQVFMQGAMEGIGFSFSSGDDGDFLAAKGLKQTGYPASDPYVTAVGGTSVAIGAKGQKIFETGWGTEKYGLSSDGASWSPIGFVYGAGGGFSSLFSRPSYQEGVVPASEQAGRAVPDVSMDGDPNTGMLVGETQTFPDGSFRYGEYRIGGTSLSSPLFAGMAALKIQNAGGSLGFMNPEIYNQVRKDKGTFTDVAGKPLDVGNVRVDNANGVDASDGLVYSVRVFNQDSSLKVTKGWDDVTGVGTPNRLWFSKNG